MTITAALVAILALAPTDDKPAPKEGADHAKIQGIWAGKSGDQGDVIDVEFEFKGSSVVMKMTRNGKTITCRGSFALGEEARPRTLDLVDFRAPEDTPPQPAPPFIYEIDGDALKLCAAAGHARPRPTEFKSGGSGPTRTVLMELKRKPPAK